MADPPGGSDLDRDTHRTPAWVKAFAVIANLVILLLLVLALARGPRGYGPQCHFSIGGDDAEMAEWYAAALKSADASHG